MASSGKNSKEMIVVSFKEIPENICVETKFISKATAMQNKYDRLYYLNQESTEVSTQPNLCTIRPVAHGVKSGNYTSMPKTLTFTPVMPNISGQQATSYTASPTVGQGLNFKTIPLQMSAAPYNTTHITSFPTPKSTNQMPISTVSVPFSNSFLQPSPFANSALLKAPAETKESACMTDPKPVCVEQEQQTSATINVSSIAIQCCIDEDFYEDLMGDECDSGTQTPAHTLSEEEEKEEFLRYVKENSIEYKNHLRECLICGEVCKSSKYFYGHMAVHRGPKCLCFLCGLCLENESLLKSHYCVGTKRKNRALLRCPQKLCKVVAVSRLELYDHLNEHNNYRMHSCSACRKSFCTAQEFLRHLLLRAKCYTEAKRNRNRLYDLRNRADRRCRVRVFTLHSHTRRTAMVKRPLSGRRTAKYLCEHCYRSFRSKYIHRCHVSKCAALLRKRNKRKKRSRNAKQN